MRETTPATDASDGLEHIAWASIPEVAEALGLRDRDVRSLIADRSIVAVRRGGRAPVIPSAFVVEDPEGGTAVVPGLRGSVIQLTDAGFSDEEIVSWLFRANDELGSTPIQALTDLRTHAVRRSAQSLAF
ncbi:Rv2175c family DNA-binding protein [Pseudactinotalea sp.]|uniref:Rv2175c family DNA-binding protein n=1 Tax=Pseudactinotalea sp. TaxID=1926260 RepID=UPI003B3B82A7